MQTLAKVVSSALRIYLHMAFLTREGGIRTKQNKEIRKDCIIYPNNTNPSPHIDGHSLRKFP